MLEAMFTYGCREDAYQLPVNPVTGTDKRRENPPPALDYYEVEEVEALARACEAREQRAGKPAIDETGRAALARLADRDEFTGPDDYVLATRFGQRLDASALRHRYKRGCTAAGLRPVRLHGLRHAAGSLIARTSDAVFVRDFLGHSKLTTTDRYLSAKLRLEEFERLDRAFGVGVDELAGGSDER
ncbi:MAG: tyrosine-type recombinase/integrase [Solirubrobacteraceae bacterium]